MTCEASAGERWGARSTASRRRGAVSGSIKTPPCPAPTVPAMTTPIRTAYTAADRPLTAVLDTVPTDAWDRPSTCEGWTVREVVRHLVQTQREFLTGRGVDLGEEPDVGADPAAAWRGHAARVDRKSVV